MGRRVHPLTRLVSWVNNVLRQFLFNGKIYNMSLLVTNTLLSTECTLRTIILKESLKMVNNRQYLL